MAPPSVYEVYSPAPQRSSIATAIITSIKVSVQFMIQCFLSSISYQVCLALDCPCDSFSRCRSESLSGRYAAARQRIGANHQLANSHAGLMEPDLDLIFAEAKQLTDSRMIVCFDVVE
jgi:hypothetical protein